MRALRESRADIVREKETRLADARGRYDRFRRLIDKAYEDKLEGRVDAGFFERKRQEWEEGMFAAHDDIDRLQRVDHKVLDSASMAKIAESKNEEGAESADGTPRRPVWWALLDLNQ